jgi:DNA recombination protein RmuC
MSSWIAASLAFVAGFLIAYLWKASRIAELSSGWREQSSRAERAERALAQEEQARQAAKDEFRLAASDAFRQIKIESDENIEQKKDLIAASVSEMRSKLEEYQRTVQTFEKERFEMYGRLESSLSQVLGAEQSIRMETAALKKVLTSSAGVRGNWGQMVLEQIFEQNDLVKGIGFDSQITLTADDGSVLRPDFVVYLPGGKKLIIDSEEVASEYILSQETDDPAGQKEHCEKLVANIRNNFNKLSRKEYQSLLDPDVRFVVMFIPSEGAIRAAFQTDSGLFQEAKEKRVILASPMTIVPLIQLIAQSWQQQRLADNARELGGIVEGLGDRLATFVQHLQNIRQGIKKTADSWDDAMGSWQKRVAPQIERARQLGGKIREFDHPELLGGEIPDSPLQKNPNLLQ